MFGLTTSIDFEIGAYSDDHAERTELVSIAQRRAGTKHGIISEHRNTVIVGDSIQI